MLFEIEDDSQGLNTHFNSQVKERPKSVIESELKDIESHHLSTLENSNPVTEQSVRVSNKLLDMFNNTGNEVEGEPEEEFFLELSDEEEQVGQEECTKYKESRELVIEDEFHEVFSENIEEIRNAFNNLADDCKTILGEGERQVTAFGEESLEDYIKKCQEQYDDDLIVKSVQEPIQEPTQEPIPKYEIEDISEPTIETIPEPVVIQEPVREPVQTTPTATEDTEEIIPSVDLEDVNIKVTNFEEKPANINKRIANLQNKINSNLPVFSIKKNIHKKLLNNLINTGEYYCENTDTYPESYIPQGIKVISIGNKTYYCYTEIPEKYSGYRHAFMEFLDNLESSLVNFNFINESVEINLIDNKGMHILAESEMEIVIEFLKSNNFQFNLKDTQLEIIL